MIAARWQAEFACYHNGQKVSQNPNPTCADHCYVDPITNGEQNHEKAIQCPIITGYRIYNQNQCNPTSMVSGNAYKGAHCQGKSQSGAQTTALRYTPNKTRGPHQ